MTKLPGTESLAEIFEDDEMGLAHAQHVAAAQVDKNPITALIGGIAVGALLGALLPITRKEREKLAPLGRKVNDKARAAVHAATEGSKAKLDELGFTRENARAQADRLMTGAKDIASAATKAVSGKGAPKA